MRIDHTFTFAGPLVVRHINVADAGTAAALSKLSKQMETIMQELDNLTSEVARNTSVDQSAITLLEGLADKLEAMKTDPAKIQALADEMRGSSDALAAAVAKNTPADTGTGTGGTGGDTGSGGDTGTGDGTANPSRRR